MQTVAPIEMVDYYRADASCRVDQKRKAELGQFLTAAPLARFLASMFDRVDGEVRVLDPGAGVGSLSAAFVERICNGAPKPCSVDLTCYEIEHLMINYLQRVLQDAMQQCTDSRIEARFDVREQDFILCQSEYLCANARHDECFTHVIMNPPYKKIHSSSAHRQALAALGIDATNLYTGFMHLAAMKLESGGELVAIVPRSFCNGPYFRSFRQQFLSMMSIRQIHVFDQRNTAFRDYGVLQENVIVHAVKGAGVKTVFVSAGGIAEHAKETGALTCSIQAETMQALPYEKIVRPADPNKFINILTNKIDEVVAGRMALLPVSLGDLGVEVSTGPIVEYRHKGQLRKRPCRSSAPLLYPAHFPLCRLEWPKDMKKPNAITVTNSSRKWLWKNKGYYVVVRRLSAKEDRRRIVASVYDSGLPGDLVGFENHLNVFHVNQRGMQKRLAHGICAFLNSSLVDRYFRQFNGHTQVNATDLRALRYPEKEALLSMGRKFEDSVFSQRTVDQILEEKMAELFGDENPLLAQKKVEQATEILRSLGLPRAQQNERSALTLLALADLKPDGSWSEISLPLIGITPIMKFALEMYGRNYAPNTRETFRRQTMHQFVEAGIALYNPDQPDRPVNSPHACYQLSQDAADVLVTYGTDGWAEATNTVLKLKNSLARKWSRERE